MASGIRATVTFSTPAGCPLAAHSTTADAPITQVSTSVPSEAGTATVTEFLADASDGSEPVFSYGTTSVFREGHDGDEQCPCERLGAFGCPVHRYVADDGELTLVFHAEDFEQLQAVVGDLRGRFPSLDVKRLLQPPLAGSPEERVFVDRGRLTDRQREVLEAAYEMGYFERPKRANATEIAAELDISQSTFTEHLNAAQRKLLGDVLEA